MKKAIVKVSKELYEGELHKDVLCYLSSEFLVEAIEFEPFLNRYKILVSGDQLNKVKEGFRFPELRIQVTIKDGCKVFTYEEV